ncbi:putative phloem protein [Helianthus anomalus]
MYDNLLRFFRFGEAVQHDYWKLYINYEIHYQLLSSQITYAVYLICKLRKDQSGFEAPMDVGIPTINRSWCICLVTPQTPVIRPNANQNTHNPINKTRIKGLPQQRNDGWVEVQIWEFQTAATNDVIPTHLILTTCGDIYKKYSGLIIDGIELRPI